MAAPSRPRCIKALRSLDDGSLADSRPRLDARRARATPWPTPPTAAQAVYNALAQGWPVDADRRRSAASIPGSWPASPRSPQWRTARRPTGPIPTRTWPRPSAWASAMRTWRPQPGNDARAATARRSAGGAPGCRASAQSIRWSTPARASSPPARPISTPPTSGEDEAPPLPGPKAIVLGSGPIRIGQGIEFDYSSVHAVRTLRAAGIRAIVINNNPETVSTDYHISDRLYFEPLSWKKC